MIKELLRYMGLAVVLFALQLLVFNNINFHGYIAPYIYPMLLLVLPLSLRHWHLLIIGFACGLLMDVFMHTLGLHATAMLIVAYLRPFVTPSDTSRAYAPGMRMGFRWFLKYALLGILVHHTVLFILEAFTFNNLSITLLRIVLSTIASTLFILILEAMRVNGSER